MATSEGSIIHAGSVRNEHCTPYDQALEAGGPNPLLMVFPNFREINKLSDLNVPESSVNMRIGEQNVTVKTTGCLPRHESSRQYTLFTRVECLEDLAQRCGNCIMTLLEKEELQ